ncbi:MAG: hypothetical protein V9E90_11165 [Saprospiraceae bacterium]
MLSKKINIGIVLSAITFLTILNYDYCRCFCFLTKNVCVYVKNESGQNIPSGYLTAYQNDTIKFYNIKNGNDVCLKYRGGGENAFNLTVKLSDNKTLQYGEYSEDGYCFDIVVTSRRIESR